MTKNYLILRIFDSDFIFKLNYFNFVATKTIRYEKKIPILLN